MAIHRHATRAVSMADEAREGVLEMDKITITKRETVQQPAEFIYWNCPRCNAGLYNIDSREPTTDDHWAWCEPCQDARYEEQKAEWVRQVKDGYRWLIGATVVDVHPNMVDFTDDACVEYARVDKVTLMTQSKDAAGTVATIEYSEYDLLRVRCPQDPDAREG